MSSVVLWAAGLIAVLAASYRLWQARQIEGLDAETAWLRRVARASRRSPLVAEHAQDTVAKETRDQL